MGSTSRVRSSVVCVFVYTVCTWLVYSSRFVLFSTLHTSSLEEDFEIGSLGFTKVKLIPDGAAAFTRGMGMSCLWDTERGFGERSWRYSMVVNDGVIEKLLVEGGGVTQNGEADPFDVSDADTMVEYLKASQKNEEL